MTATPELVTDLKGQVLLLEDDLRQRVETQPDILARWQDQHSRATRAERTASSWVEWLDDRVTQAAVAWVLTTVFVRFCEDNALLSPVWIAGPLNRRQEALDAQNAYFRANPTHTDREWLGQAISHLAKTPATASLVGKHSMLHSVSPSGQAATALLAFWRERDDAGALRHDLSDPALSTRFLGDIYQDLSEHAQKTFALLQTPEFVEEFILDQTMEPALAERSLEEFRLIDPACGSGHFLLGAFRRLLARWESEAPALGIRDRVQRCLDSISGVDLNPFATAITRFRLILAALQAIDGRSLERAPAFSLHIETGDSLLHGHAQTGLDFASPDENGASGFTYANESLDALRDVLHPGTYDVVVGNPPYITVRDRSLNVIYRQLFASCKGTYALTVPFMELFYSLARPRRGDRPAGWTGQITSNSFMTREFGSKLIEEYLVTKDLTRVVDTSRAYIPGHGTPTVIMIGRNQGPTTSSLRAVLGIRGEPERPSDPAEGLVWRSIAENIDRPGHEDQWTSVVDLDRDRLRSHPWSLGGGGASDLVQALTSANVLGNRVHRIGFYGDSHADEAFFLPAHVPPRLHLPQSLVFPATRGEATRDWMCRFDEAAFLPYDSERRPIAPNEIGEGLQSFWPLRTVLWARQVFGGVSYQEAGRSWLDWHQLPLDVGAAPQAIPFAFVTTHNHFVFDRGGKVYNRSAPVIKLPGGATEDDHLAILSVLNSSTACFWLKQNSHNKGNGGIGGGIGDEDWEPRYEFTGTTLLDFPLPEEVPLERARQMERLAQQLAASSPAAVCSADTDPPTHETLRQAESAWVQTKGLLIAGQEELDWDIYYRYGITDTNLAYRGDPPPLSLGQRAFEIALARRVAAGEERTAWFERHGSTAITEAPGDWPPAYRDLVRRRLQLIAEDRFIGLLERPEYKRRWASEPWEQQRERALRAWLLSELESPRFWFDRQGRPTPRSLSEIADQVSREPKLISVVTLWEGRPDVPIRQSLARLFADEAVPYLAALRLKDSGLRKLGAWEHTWALQRRQDHGESVGPIPVPPKYASADFRQNAYWLARGKLDLPRERFILYPDAGRSTEPSPLLGWAGWSHAQRALALGTIIGAREAEGASEELLIPLVAGLAELQPWVEQWHSGIDPAYGVSLAAFCAEQLADRARQVGRSLDQLRQWRPAAPARGRRPRS